MQVRGDEGNCTSWACDIHATSSEVGSAVSRSLSWSRFPLHACMPCNRFPPSCGVIITQRL
jgi:hypothetical protein